MSVTYDVRFPGQSGRRGLRTPSEVAAAYRDLVGSQRSDYYPVIVGSDGRKYDLQIDDSTDEGAYILVPVDQD